jgi:hypothetical protein
MPVRTPYRTTPSLGPELWQVEPIENYWDQISKSVGSTTIVASYPIGTQVVGNDGHQYVYVRASAAIASGATVILTEPAFTIATGAGAFTAPVTVGAVAIAINSFVHARRTAI